MEVGLLEIHLLQITHGDLIGYHLLGQQRINSVFYPQTYIFSFFHIHYMIILFF